MPTGRLSTPPRCSGFSASSPRRRSPNPARSASRRSSPSPSRPDMDDPVRRLLEGLVSSLRDAEFDAFLKLGQGRVPDQVFVAFDTDPSGRVLHLQLLFVPGLDDPPVLQYYVGLPYA